MSMELNYFLVALVSLEYITLEHVAQEEERVFDLDCEIQHYYTV